MNGLTPATGSEKLAAVPTGGGGGAAAAPAAGGSAPAAAAAPEPEPEPEEESDEVGIVCVSCFSGPTSCCRKWASVCSTKVEK